MKNVSVIGLGIMGLRAAILLRDSGFEVQGHDPFPAAAQRAAKEGIRVFETPGDSAAGVTTVIMFVPGPSQTESVVTGPGGILEKAVTGLTVVNSSTVDPGTNIRMSEKAASAGIHFLDAPLLGRPSGAGTWSFLVGGELSTLEKAMPVLEVLSGSQSRIFHMGRLGNGNKAKLLNNLMFGAINACTAEVMALASHLGVPQKALFDAAVAAGASVVSNLYKELAPRIIDGRFDDPNFTVDMLLKDNKLALAMAQDAGAPLVVGASVDWLNRMASAHGLGAEDTAAMGKLFTALWSGSKSPMQ